MYPITFASEGHAAAACVVAWPAPAVKAATIAAHTITIKHRLHAFDGTSATFVEKVGNSLRNHAGNHARTTA